MENKGTFKKGHDLAKGRPKGASNKTTGKAKELVVALVESALPEAMAKLQQIKDPKDYLDALAKFISYVVPKQTEVSANIHTEGAIVDWAENSTKARTSPEKTK